MDSNGDPVARWKQLAAALAFYDYILPDAPLAEGVILSPADRPTLGVWMMPDNVRPGALEHLLFGMKPDADDLWPLAEQAVAGIPKDKRRFKPQHELKAVVRTWLAWQETPGLPPGEAVKRDMLNPNALAATPLMDWLLRLFPTDA